MTKAGPSATTESLYPVLSKEDARATDNSGHSKMCESTKKRRTENVLEKNGPKPTLEPPYHALSEEEAPVTRYQEHLKKEAHRTKRSLGSEL